MSSPDAFPRVGKQPVLIDFTHSIADRDSLLATAAASDVPRREHRGVMRLLHRLYAAPNRVAARHAVALRDALIAEVAAPTLLVIGGGTVGSGTEPLYDDPRLRVIAFDIYASPHTGFVADAHGIPLADGSVDAVWVQAVLEHVLDPWQVAREIARVLTPRGLLYAETPFLQQVHEGAYDFTRFTESGHRWLFRQFERIDSGVTAGPGTQLLWSLDHAARGFLRSRIAGRLTRAAFFWLQWLDGLAARDASVDGASCVYFFGRKSLDAVTPRQMVKEYRGAQRGR